MLLSMEVTLIQLVQFVLMFIEVTEAEPENKSSYKRNDTHSPVIPDKKWISRECYFNG